MLSEEIENAHIFTRPDIDYLGINLNSKQFFTLNQQNFENCALSTSLYCKINEPIIQLEVFDTKTSCVLYSFTENDIDPGICENFVTSPSQNLPIAKFISEGKWLIISQKVTTFSINCQHQATKIVHLKTPYDYIQLQRSCSAYSEHITLISGENWAGMSELETIPIRDFEINSDFAWQLFNNSLNHNWQKVKGHLRKLSRGTTLKTEELVHELEGVGGFWVEPVTAHIPILVYFLVGLSLIGVCVYFYLYKRKTRVNRPTNGSLEMSAMKSDEHIEHVKHEFEEATKKY